MDYDGILEKYYGYYLKHLEYVYLCSEKKAELILYTNWDKVNEERKEQGLPKISNQSMKEAYVKLDKVYCNLLKLRDKYDAQETYYHYLLLDSLKEKGKTIELQD